MQFPVTNPLPIEYRYDCNRRYLCEDNPDCTRICRSCRLCNNLCPDFEEDVCIKLSTQPYVCNGCADERLCTLRKRYYLHHQAHKAYRETLVQSRTGANISEDELLLLNEFVSPLILKGQSVHHIVVNNRNQFRVSEKSIYRYVAGGLLRAKNIDMPRVCRLKPRKENLWSIRSIAPAASVALTLIFRSTSISPAALIPSKWILSLGVLAVKS